MAKRPPTLIYSVDEKTLPWTAILHALPHVVVISVGWIQPVVILQVSGVQAADWIQMHFDFNQTRVYPR